MSNHGDRDVPMDRRNEMMTTMEKIGAVVVVVALALIIALVATGCRKYTGACPITDWL